jgi:hypothetical protein
MKRIGDRAGAGTGACDMDWKLELVIQVPQPRQRAALIARDVLG